MSWKPKQLLTLSSSIGFVSRRLFYPEWIKKKITLVEQVGAWNALQWCGCEAQNPTEIQPNRLASTYLNLVVESWISMQWCAHWEGRSATKLQSYTIASTSLNPRLRSSNRVKPSRLGLNLPQPASTLASTCLNLPQPGPQPASTCLNLCCWASRAEGWGHTKGLVGLKS